ncbi:MAG TPA: type 4a pilus biogenesis protein PilO [Gammaproteobacteria bacterium]|nr:type 4a pilus biogenesis protein PilO [Gammaproteobacteria bacterium]
MAIDLNNLNFDLQALNDLDIREAGNWPVAGKAVVMALIFAVIVGGGWYLAIRDQGDELKAARKQEVTLKQQFETKAAKAANLDKLKEQMKEMRASFGTLLRQLPSKTEVDSLLRDISQTAKIDGLQQELFQPQGENKKDFYAEKPIRMVVSGSYHDLAKFVSDVAALPRIVTLHNISIKPTGKQAGGRLTMELTAKIYRYLEQNGGKG